MFRMFRKHPKSLFAALIAVSTLAAAGPAAAQAAQGKCRADGNLVNAGGFDTVSAHCQRVAPGIYDITFSGQYGVTGPENVVVNTTAESAVYGVSNAVVTTATPAQIVVRVYTWASATQSLVDNAFFITVFTGPSYVILPP